MKAYGGSKGDAPLNFTLGTRRRWVVNVKPQTLWPGKITPVPTGHKTGWAPQPVLPVLKKRKSLAPSEIWNLNFSAVPFDYTDYATEAPFWETFASLRTLSFLRLVARSCWKFATLQNYNSKWPRFCIQLSTGYSTVAAAYLTFHANVRSNITNNVRGPATATQDL